MSKNDDALRCADDINSVVPNCSPLAAAHLRRLVAENEAQVALLRLAVEALEKSSPQPLYSCRCQGNEHWMYCHFKRHQDAITSIRQHLEGKS